MSNAAAGSILFELVEAARRLLLLSKVVPRLDPLQTDLPALGGAHTLDLQSMAECAAHAATLLIERRLTWAFDPAGLSILARAANLRGLEDLQADAEACDSEGSGPDIDDGARRACLFLCGTLTKEPRPRTQVCQLYILVDDAAERRRQKGRRISFGRVPDAVVLREIGSVESAMERLFDARGLSQHERLDLLSGIHP